MSIVKEVHVVPKLLEVMKESISETYTRCRPLFGVKHGRSDGQT